MKYIITSCNTSKIIDSSTFYGKFEIGPWASGQALTVANTLRRGLLSELPGTAITFIKLIGSTHEYQTLPGMSECILDLLLNFKKIILNSELQIISPQIGFLHVRGPGTIKARDLQLPYFINVQNPDQYIATLNHTGILNIKFLIHSGKNYLYHTPSSSKHLNWVKLLDKKRPLKFLNYTNQFFLATNNNYKYFVYKRELINIFCLMNSLLVNKSISKEIKYKLSKYAFYRKTNSVDSLYSRHYAEPYYFNSDNIGYFPINAIFSPIKKVNYTIQLQHQLTKKEIILLEIWTNGTINPRTAIHQSSKRLIKLFLPLQELKVTSFTNKKSKLYFNQFDNIYFNRQINKLTNFYNLFETYNFTKCNKTLFNIKNNTFQNKNSIFKLKRTPNKLFKYNTLVNFTSKSNITTIHSNQFNIINQLTTISNSLKQYNNFKKLNINLNNNSTTLNYDISYLNINSDIYSILKLLNYNIINDFVLFNNYYYQFNKNLFETLKMDQLLELKYSLKQSGINIYNKN